MLRWPTDYKLGGDHPRHESISGSGITLPICHNLQDILGTSPVNIQSMLLCSTNVYNLIP